MGFIVLLTRDLRILWEYWFPSSLSIILPPSLLSLSFLSEMRWCYVAHVSFGTCYVVETSFKLGNPPASAFQVLRLRACPACFHFSCHPGKHYFVVCLSLKEKNRSRMHSWQQKESWYGGAWAERQAVCMSDDHCTVPGMVAREAKEAVCRPSGLALLLLLFLLSG